MSGEELARSLNARRIGNGWMARCPAHDDHTPSLSIEEHHVRVFLRCYAGCNWRDVAAALEARGLWQDRGG